MSTPLLFFVCVLVWGSTWIAITFQLGEVEPVVSVAYRYTLAAVFLGGYCLFKGESLRLSKRVHLLTGMAGFFLYTMDYSLLYESQQYLVSAVTAVMSSCIIYFNVILRKFLLAKPVRPAVVIGSSFGFVGMFMIFLPEFQRVEVNHLLWLGIGLAMASFVFASLGNVVSELVLDKGTSVLAMNFWAMSYSLIFLYGFALLKGYPLILPTEPDYYGSLMFLALFGSVIAFGAYMKLVQQIGSDKSAYVVLLYPMVALFWSTLLEGYQWTVLAALGLLIVLLGNAIAMEKITLKRTPPLVQTSNKNE